MALTADQYRAEAENALSTAKSKAGTGTTAPQAEAYAHIADVYTRLYEATKSEVV